MSDRFIQYFAIGLGQFFGVFLGVVAGLCITLSVESVKWRKKRKQELTNLRFELDLNQGNASIGFRK